MTSTTWMTTSADLLGLGRLCSVDGPTLGAGVTDRAVTRLLAPVAPAQGTGLHAGSAVRLRPVTRRAFGDAVVATDFFDNNGTTLGIHSSRRPQS